MSGATRRTAGVAATERLGEALAPVLAPGDLLVLTGPLGSGKTRFVAGLARGLAAAARVRSPTFTLVNEYRGRIPLVHLDLYRVAPGDTDGLGLEEYLEHGALAVEWGERLPAGLRREALTLTFAIEGPEARALAAAAAAGRGLALLEAWRALPSAADAEAPEGAR